MAKLINLVITVFLIVCIIIGILLFAFSIKQILFGKKEYTDEGIHTFHSVDFFTKNRIDEGKDHTKYFVKYQTEDKSYEFDQEIEESEYNIESTVEKKVFVNKDNIKDYDVVELTESLEEYGKKKYEENFKKMITGGILILGGIILLYIFKKH